MTRLNVAFSALLLSLLAACGGGGSDEEPTVPAPTVDCKTNPQQCA